VGLKRSAALARIAELEQGQHRTVRETLIRVCHAMDALKEALASESPQVRDAVDRMYASLSRLELLEKELGQLRADL
jgi:division protein CdvB (Snf7/Vps24/ESCRT-III family)